MLAITATSLPLMARYRSSMVTELDAIGLKLLYYIVVQQDTVSPAPGCTAPGKCQLTFRFSKIAEGLAFRPFS